MEWYWEILHEWQSKMIPFPGEGLQYAMKYQVMLTNVAMELIAGEILYG